MEAKTTGAAHFFKVSNTSLCSPSRSPFLSLLPAAPFTAPPVFSLQNGVVHRDLKLENILLDDSCNIKVKLLPGGLIGGAGASRCPRLRPRNQAAESCPGRRVQGSHLSSVPTLHFDEHLLISNYMPDLDLSAGIKR